MWVTVMRGAPTAGSGVGGPKGTAGSGVGGPKGTDRLRLRGATIHGGARTPGPPLRGALQWRVASPPPQGAVPPRGGYPP